MTKKNEEATEEGGPINQLITDLTISGRLIYDGVDQRIVQMKMEKQIDGEGNPIGILNAPTLLLSSKSFPEDFNPLAVPFIKDPLNNVDPIPMEHDVVEGTFEIKIQVVRRS